VQIQNAEPHTGTFRSLNFGHKQIDAMSKDFGGLMQSLNTGNGLISSSFDQNTLPEFGFLGPN
jgi:hypothetical protein